MAVLTLGQAARLTGLSKSTVSRAIRAGRMSAERCADGTYRVDTSELARCYTITPEALATDTTGAATGGVTHHATGDATPTPDAQPIDATVLRVATLEAELKGLRELLHEVKASRDELRGERDAWREQAERVALPAPVPARRWWPWR